MLKISEITESTTQLGKGVVGVDADSRVGHNGNELNRNEIDNSEVDGNKIDDETGKKCQKISKSKNLFKSKKLCKSKKTLESDFFTSEARLAFTKLRQVFVKAPILY